MELKLENGRPADTTGRLEKEIRTYDFLDALQVPYQRIDHETLMTIEACKDVDKVLDAVICKNLFLCNRQETNFYLLLLPGDKKFKQTDTHFNHVPACLISVFIQFLFALPLLYQCKYTLKYNEEAQQDCCYNVGPGADQFSIGFNQSRNRTIDQYTK